MGHVVRWIHVLWDAYFHHVRNAMEPPAAVPVGIRPATLQDFEDREPTLEPTLSAGRVTRSEQQSRPSPQEHIPRTPIQQSLPEFEPRGSAWLTDAARAALDK